MPNENFTNSHLNVSAFFSGSFVGSSDICSCWFFPVFGFSSGSSSFFFAASIWSRTETAVASLDAGAGWLIVGCFGASWAVWACCRGCVADATGFAVVTSVVVGVVLGLLPPPFVFAFRLCCFLFFLPQQQVNIMAPLVVHRMMSEFRIANKRMELQLNLKGVWFGFSRWTHVLMLDGNSRLAFAGKGLGIWAGMSLPDSMALLLSEKRDFFILES